MGTQITVEREDMLRAGWSVTIMNDPALLAEDGSIEYPESEYDLYSKWDTETEQLWKLHSFVLGAFCGDCNNWGSSMKRMQEFGILSLPHVLS